MQSILPILLCIALAAGGAATAAGADSSPEPDILHFDNGREIYRGSLKELTNGAVLFSSRNAIGDLRLTTSNLSAIVFTPPAATTNALDTIYLTNGDYLRGRVTRIADGRVRLAGLYEKDASIATNLVTTMTFNTPSSRLALLKEDFNHPYPNVQLHGDKWSILENRLVHQASPDVRQFVSIPVQQDGPVTIEFEITPSSDLNALHFSLSVYAATNTHCYGHDAASVWLGNGTVSYADVVAGRHQRLQRQNVQSIISTVLATAEFAEPTYRCMLTVEPEKKLIRFYLNEKLIGNFSATRTYRDGKYIVIYAKQFCMLDNIVITPGVVALEEVAPGDASRDRLHFKNGDQLVGALTGFENDQLHFRGPYGDMRLPRKNLHTIHLAATARERPRRRRGDVLLYLGNDSRATAILEAVTPTRLHLTSDYAGRGQLPRDRVARILFDIYD